MWDTRPLHPQFGVEILGVTLHGGIPEAMRHELRSLLDRHSVLLFRRQDLSNEAHVDLISSFGRVSDEQGDGVRFAFVSNVRPDGLFGDWPLPFHQDYGTFQSVIAPVISLYGLDLHGPSMPTTFANLAHAWRSLPGDLRRKITDRRIVHSVNLAVDTGTQGYERRARLLELPEYPPESAYPRKTYPIAIPHPRNGETLLFVSEMHTSHIEGMTSEESESIVQQLFQHMYAPEAIYAHAWERGDLLIWDNLATQHGRRPIDPSPPQQKRTLRRVLVCEKSAREIFSGVRYNNSKGFKVGSGYGPTSAVDINS